MKFAEGSPTKTHSAGQLSLAVKKTSSKQGKTCRTGRSTVRSHSSGHAERAVPELNKRATTSFPSPKALSAAERASLLAKLKRNPVFEKRICGDVFGSTLVTGGMEGLLYRSRMAPDSSTAQSTPPETPLVEDPILQRSRMSLDHQEDDSSGDSDHAIDERMTPDQRLARTLCNWSKHEANASRMLDDGAVHALIALGSVDDVKIKEDVAAGLYYLTCKPGNRSHLLRAGAAAALVQISMATKQWRTARTCACALGHLSMHQGGEDTMGKEGAVLAVVILLGVRDHRLAHICLHTLFNLTCVKDSFAGIERISRSLLGMSSIVQQDARPLILKGICNCVRFPALRTRILEDGVLQLIASTLHTYASSANNNAADITDVNCIASCVRLLSESKVSRNDMIAKGGIEILRQLLPFSDDQCQPQMVQALHNILPGNNTQIPYSRPIAMQVVYELSDTQHLASIRHLASLIYWLLQQNSTKACCLKLSTALQRFIGTDDAVAQIFAALACASIFQHDFVLEMTFSEESVPLFDFAVGILDVIPRLAVTDNRAVEAFSMAIWRICEVKAIREFLKATDRLEGVVQLPLNLATTDCENVQVYCCLSICALTEVLDDLKLSHRQQVASILLRLLCCEQDGVYAYAVGGIYRAVEKHLCDQELLSSTTVQRLIQIASSTSQDDSARHICCAILASLSYSEESHELLGEPAVLQPLLKIGQDDVHNTQMTVAVCICNLSANPAFRDVLLDNSVACTLAALSSAGTENVQKLCAIAFCNLTCVITRHHHLLKEGGLTSLLMIGLVRAVSTRTKQICAQALLNFISGSCLTDLLREGIVRAFATLSFVECEVTQRICAHAFVVMSCDSHGRKELTTHRNVLKAVFGLIRCQSRDTNMMLARTLCNLTSHHESKVAVLRAGALGVLRIVGTLPIQEVREDCVKVITMLGCQPETRAFLLKEEILSVLILYIRSADATLFEQAVIALSILSSFKEFQQELVALGCTGAMVHAVLSGKMTSATVVQECAQCLRYLSSAAGQAEEVLNQNTIIALQLLWRVVSTSDDMHTIKTDVAKHILMTLKNLSCLPGSEDTFMKQHGLELAVNICLAIHDPEVGLTSAVIMYHMVRDERMHLQVVNSGIVAALSKAVWADGEFAYFATTATQRLTTTEACRPLAAAQNVCAIFDRLLDTSDEASKLPMAQALRNLAGCKDCRQCIVDQGAVEILMSLSGCLDEETQRACSDAMSFLSEFTNLQAGAVDVLLKMSPRQRLDGQMSSSARSPVRVARTSSFYFRVDQHSVIGVTPPTSSRSRNEQRERTSTQETAEDAPPLAREFEQSFDFPCDAIQAAPAGGAPQVDVFIEYSMVSNPPMNAELTELQIDPIPRQMDPYAKVTYEYEVSSLDEFLLQPPEVSAPAPVMEQELPQNIPQMKVIKSPGARSKFLKRFSRSSFHKSSSNLLG